jgi:hypothetical protein
MKKQLTLYADSTGQITADDAANPSTVAMRDSSAGMANVSETVDNLTVNKTALLGAHASVTSVAALDATAVIWPFDGTGGAFAPTLPAVASCAKRVYICKRTAASGNITLTPNGAETIDGATTYVLSAQWSTVWLFSDGTQWLILAKF